MLNATKLPEQVGTVPDKLPSLPQVRLTEVTPGDLL